MQGKCIHPKQPVVFEEKTELPWAGFKPATSCVLDWCSTNWATEAAQLAESNPKMLGNAKQLSLYIYMRGSSFFLGNVTALGVLCCFALFVCLTLLASFFLPSHLSLKHVLYEISIKFSSPSLSLSTQQAIHCLPACCAGVDCWPPTPTERCESVSVTTIYHTWYAVQW